LFNRNGSIFVATVYVPSALKSKYTKNVLFVAKLGHKSIFGVFIAPVTCLVVANVLHAGGVNGAPPNPLAGFVGQL